MRPSESLEETIAIERSKGTHTFTEITQAYEFLGITDGVCDLAVLQLLENTSPTNEQKEYLRIIAEMRDSAVLDHFLKTRNPLGLINIGNTYPLLCIT